MACLGNFDTESVRRRVLAHNLRESGYTREEICRQTGVTERNVTRYLAKSKPQIIEMRRNQSWRDRAACIGKANIFFPTGWGIGAKKQKERAVEICRGCPVIDRCREAALANFENYGVWAGEDFSTYRYWINEETGEVSVSVQGSNGEVKKIC